MLDMLAIFLPIVNFHNQDAFELEHIKHKCH
jgi:hypothetical protein